MATNPDTVAPAKRGGTKKVRVLIAHDEHLPNHVITVPASVDTKGWGDEDGDAIAYAEANEPQPAPAADEAKA
jgi:hypothetical protein